MKKIIIILYFVILIIVNLYCNFKYDEIRNQHQALIINTQNNPDELINNTIGISSKKRALSFYQGNDNDTIYSPEITYNSDGSTSYITNDESKLKWNDLFEQDKIIYTFSANDCNVKLKKKEVLLHMNLVDKEQPKFYNSINKTITFKYNDSLLDLNIKDIKEADSYVHICIANELYNELIKTENNYIYAIKFNKYKDFKTTFDNLRNKNEDMYIGVPSKVHSISSKESTYGDIIDYLSILNLISLIFFIVNIVYDLIKFLNNQLNKNN